MVVFFAVLSVFGPKNILFEVYVTKMCTLYTF